MAKQTKIGEVTPATPSKAKIRKPDMSDDAIQSVEDWVTDDLRAEAEAEGTGDAEMSADNDDEDNQDAAVVHAGGVERTVEMHDGVGSVEGANSQEEENNESEANFNEASTSGGRARGLVRGRFGRS